MHDLCRLKLPAGIPRKANNQSERPPISPVRKMRLVAGSRNRHDLKVRHLVASNPLICSGDLFMSLPEVGTIAWSER